MLQALNIALHRRVACRQISAEQKRELLAIFEKDLCQAPDESADLLLASAHMLRNETYIHDSLAKILDQSAKGFTEGHVTSLLALMRKVSMLEGPANQAQESLINEVEKYFKARSLLKKAW